MLNSLRAIFLKINDKNWWNGRFSRFESTLSRKKKKKKHKLSIIQKNNKMLVTIKIWLFIDFKNSCGYFFINLRKEDGKIVLQRAKKSCN